MEIRKAKGMQEGIQNELLDAKFNDSWIILGEVENKGVDNSVQLLIVLILRFGDCRYRQVDELSCWREEDNQGKEYGGGYSFKT